MKMLARIWFAGALGLVGCDMAIPCTTSADCRDGQGVCDPAIKVCIGRRTASDGGVDAGPPRLCGDGCREWQTCMPTSISDGVCVNATIRALRPDNGAQFTGGNPVTFVFEVTQWDGGMWPRDVPFSTSEGMAGPGFLAKKATTFEAEVTLANKAGTQSVVAGWVAVDAGVTVVTERCNASCKPYEECVPDASGGACVDMGLTLTFNAPTVSDAYGPINSGQVAVLVTASRADGGPFLAPIPFALSKGVALRAVGQLGKSGATTWTGTVDAGADDGSRELFAGWDGGPHATGTFSVTATPPTLALYPQTAPGRPANQTDSDNNPRWKKAEVAPVQLESNRPLLGAPTAADFSGSGIAASSKCTRNCSAGAHCYCFEVDLAQQVFTQAAPGSLYGAAPVSLNKSLTDALGNSGTAAPATFDVTRFKWSQNIASATAATPTAIALTSSGIVTTAATVGANSTLTALNPDGGIAWQKNNPTEAITAGPMVGQTGIYFAVSTGGEGRLRKLSFDGVTPADKCIFSGLSYPGDLALVSPGPSEFPLAVARYASSTDAKLMGSDSSSCYPSAAFTTLSASARPTLVVDNTQAYVAVSTQDPIWKFSSLSSSPTPQGLRSTDNLFPANLFLAGTDVVGGGGGGGGPTVGGVFAFYDVGGALDGGATVNATPGTKPGGAVVVGPPTQGDTRPWVYYGDSGGNARKVRLTPTNPPAYDSPDALSIGGDLSPTSPLLGANHQMYVASANTLYALDSTGPSREWHWTAPDAIATQLNLDINRDAANPCAPGQPGVLYVVTSSGTQTTVYAILVDSQGVDATAPWPRYQHDPGGTGNSGTDLSPWGCP